MKQCPKCNRQYQDDMRFCLEDGTALTGEDVRSTIASPTMVLPTNEQSGPTMSQVGRADVPLPGENEARLRVTKLPASGSSGSVLVTRIIGIVLLLIAVILSLVGLAVWSQVFARRLPFTLTLIAAMLVAIIRADRHPKVSLLASIALGFDLIQTFIYIWVSRVISGTVAQYQVLSAVDDFAFAGTIILLTAAVLSERASQPVTN